MGSPPFWASNCKIRIKTLPPLESQHSGFFNGAIVLIILHFDAQNGREHISPILMGRALFPRLTLLVFGLYYSNTKWFILEQQFVTVIISIIAYTVIS